MPVVASSQCPGGPVQLESYSTGVQLAEMGVMSAGDMTVEATVMKLGYLISLGLRGRHLRDRFEANLVGERSEAGREDKSPAVYSRQQNTIRVPFV